MGLDVLVGIGAGFVLGIGRIEWALIVFAIALVWLGEALNTGVELACDAITKDPHPLIGKAKDVAAAGVLISAMGAATIGALVLGPPLVQLIQRIGA